MTALDPRRYLLGFGFVLMWGCYIPGSDKESEWVIRAHRSPSWENERLEDGEWTATPAMNLLKVNPERVPWEFSNDLIRGFEHRWGVEYRIRVLSRHPILNYLEIGPDFVRTLIKVEEQVPRPGERFRLHAIGAPWLGTDRRSFSDGQAFACDSPRVCDALDERLKEDSARFDMVMQHGPISGELVLLEVEERTCVTLSECRDPPTHAAGNICCRGECMPSRECQGDPWRANP